MWTCVRIPLSGKDGWHKISRVRGAEGEEEGAGEGEKGWSGSVFAMDFRPDTASGMISVCIYVCVCVCAHVQETGGQGEDTVIFQKT